MVVGTSTEYLNVTTKGREVTKRLLIQIEVQCFEVFNLFFCVLLGVKKKVGTSVNKNEDRVIE